MVKKEKKDSRKQMMNQLSDLRRCPANGESPDSEKVAAKMKQLVTLWAEQWWGPCVLLNSNYEIACKGCQAGTFLGLLFSYVDEDV